MLQTGCSTVDGVTGFKNWKHPDTGRDKFFVDKKDCEDRADNVTAGIYSKEDFGSVKNSSENAGNELGRLFAVWDYTKKCLIEKGYKKDE
jgi:hypothetical protein